MDFWLKVLLAAHVVIALGIIGLVLLQHGKGADMGSGFGGGASSSLFGATGSANFLSRTTAVMATAFFLSSLGLTYLATNKPQAGGSVMESVKPQPVERKAPEDVPVPKESAAPDGPASKKVPN
ncbi:MAG: preprotein translocase subunit SecG [Betaproteobacteria bacterium SG8_39]|nr:MAG: preprotein translocase subunit SecG [Betaproteobacteria bacterium SG8_39]